MHGDIYWVGAIDWTVRDFHGYHTREGSSYNSYLILDDIPTIIDAVKAPFGEELVERIERLVPLDQVKQVVMNHAEGDHSGALPYLISKLPNATIFTNQICADTLKILYPELV